MAFKEILKIQVMYGRCCDSGIDGYTASLVEEYAAAHGEGDTIAEAILELLEDLESLGAI